MQESCNRTRCSGSGWQTLSRPVARARDDDGGAELPGAGVLPLNHPGGGARRRRHRDGRGVVDGQEGPLLALYVRRQGPAGGSSNKKMRTLAAIVELR